jgi:hypothetical protein
VEAEVGPIKYIAKFIYGEHGADENMLEKAVTWIIVLIVVVFDPLAVIMLLAAQMTFGWRKEEPTVVEPSIPEEPVDEPIQEVTEEIKETPLDFEGVREPGGEWIQTGPTFEVPVEQTHTEVPSETQPTALGGDITASEEKPVEAVEDLPLEQWNKMIEEAEKAVEEEKRSLIEEEAKKYSEVTGDRIKPDLTEVIETEGSKKKTYMTKDDQGNIQIKSRE